jgi:hypothetical protein
MEATWLAKSKLMSRQLLLMRGILAVLAMV